MYFTEQQLSSYPEQVVIVLTIIDIVAWYQQTICYQKYDDQKLFYSKHNSSILEDAYMVFLVIFIYFYTSAVSRDVI